MTNETGSGLPRSTPEEQGIPSAALRAFVDEAERDGLGLHSIMLLRHGHVVAEGWWAPYGPDIPHMLFSLSKSFTSSAVGLAVEEGRLSVDDRVLSFFPEEAPADVSEHLAAMRVRHLLSMSTGHAEDTTGPMVNDPEGDWARAFLAQPVAHAPGTHFVYNSGATYMLSAIVQRLTGATVLEYLRPRLLDPLGIAHATWQSCPRGVNVGGWGLSITTDSIARFGQLYLQRGVWRGRRVLPEAWVDEATASHISNGDDPASDWAQGYGYQFWRCRHGAYRGDGAFGQFCVVLPEQDAVLAITAGTPDMQAVLNLAWARLLPALGDAPLQADGAAHAELTGRLASLAMRPQEGSALSPAAAGVSGRAYRFEPNDQGVEELSFDFEDGGCVVRVRDRSGEQRLACGSGAWRLGSFAVDGGAPGAVAASGAWTADDTYTMQLCFYETPFCPTITCRFEDDRLLYDFRANVSFGPTQRPQLVGRRA